MKRILCYVWILLLASFTGGVSNVNAQEQIKPSQTTIVGRIVDGSGGPIPGATVRASGVNRRVETISGPEGRFELVVGAGTYELQGVLDCEHTGASKTVSIEEGHSIAVDVEVRTFRATFSDISIYRLLAEPDKYDGRFVRVSGFYRFDKGMSQLFASKEDADYLIGKNSLWVTFADSQVVGRSASGRDLGVGSPIYFNAKPVILEGVFEKSNCGSGASSGSIRDVSRISELIRYFDGARRLK